MVICYESYFRSCLQVLMFFLKVLILDMHEVSLLSKIGVLGNKGLKNCFRCNKKLRFVSACFIILIIDDVYVLFILRCIAIMGS